MRKCFNLLFQLITDQPEMPDWPMPQMQSTGMMAQGILTNHLLGCPWLELWYNMQRMCRGRLLQSVQMGNEFICKSEAGGTPAAYDQLSHAKGQPEDQQGTLPVRRPHYWLDAARTISFRCGALCWLQWVGMAGKIFPGWWCVKNENHHTQLLGYSLKGKAK